MKHKTKAGKLIDLKDLELDHLKKVVKRIKRKAIKGLLIQKEIYFCGVDFSDQYTIYGKEVKDHFNYKAYKKELKRRTKLKKETSIKDFFESIDYSLLQKQKEELLKFQFDCDYGLPVETLNELEGLVNFIDNFQDFVVDKLGHKESEVFNLEEND